MSVHRVSPPFVRNPRDLTSQVVTVEGTRVVHLAGQVARDGQGRPVGLGDHGAQAAQIARNLDAALAAVGATRNDIVEETVYAVDYAPDLLPAIFGPLRSGVSEPPASTLVGVSALSAPEHLLEVQVVAALPGPDRQARAVPADDTATSEYAGARGLHRTRETPTEGEEQDLETALTRRAWEDPVFAERLEREPLEALASMGIRVSPGVKVQVRTQRRDTLYYVVPPARRPGEPDRREPVNLMDLWRSGDNFVWLLPEALKTELLAMRRGFHEAPASPTRSSHEA
ncbi:RidA family protein [Streptomyces anthocyanicus]|uniref:RidA family protein n=1 Tax=Streptomyces TaxID=1883 RepID=UPI0029B804DD|nr:MULTISPECIES: RidA family protein [Streptomyces]MDX3349399.1 RidA family protein [Streptomyces sp. ME02-6979A]